MPRGVQMTWEEQKLQSFGPFVAHAPSEAEDPPDTTTLRLQVEATKDGHSTDARLSAFSLALPTPETEVLNISFASLVFLEKNGRPPTLEVGRFEFTFAGALQLVADLQKQASALIGGKPPKVDVRPDGISGSYDIRIEEASAGAFLMRNIAVLIEVDIPFRAGLPTVRSRVRQPGVAVPAECSAIRRRWLPPAGGRRLRDQGADRIAGVRRDGRRRLRRGRGRGPRHGWRALPGRRV